MFVLASLPTPETSTRWQARNEKHKLSRVYNMMPVRRRCFHNSSQWVQRCHGLRLCEMREKKKLQFGCRDIISLINCFNVPGSCSPVIETGMSRRYWIFASVEGRANPQNLDIPHPVYPYPTPLFSREPLTTTFPVNFHIKMIVNVESIEIPKVPFLCLHHKSIRQVFYISGFVCL